MIILSKVSNDLFSIFIKGSNTGFESIVSEFARRTSSLAFDTKPYSERKNQNVGNFYYTL